MESGGKAEDDTSIEEGKGNETPTSKPRRFDWRWITVAIVVPLLVAAIPAWISSSGGNDRADPTPPAATSSPSPSPTPQVVIDTPKKDEVVSYPQPLNGRIVGRKLASNEELWAGVIARDGLYHTLGSTCVVRGSQSFECVDIFVGTANERDTERTICIFLVNDATQFRNYAARPNASTSFPGFPLDRGPVLAEECIKVRR
jgi:hypothetical protein